MADNYITSLKVKVLLFRFYSIKYSYIYCTPKYTVHLLYSCVCELDVFFVCMCHKYRTQSNSVLILAVILYFIT